MRFSIIYWGDFFLGGGKITNQKNIRSKYDQSGSIQNLHYTFRPSILQYLLLILNQFRNRSLTMTPRTSLFNSTSSINPQRNRFLIISSITMTASNFTPRIVVNCLWSYISTVISYNPLNRLKWISHNLLLHSSSLILIILYNLLSHHHILHSHCIDLLLLLPAP